MNIDQQNRFEIMKALEKAFPDRLLEDLIDVARYVEGGGVERVREVEAGVFERAREESQDSAAKSLGEASGTPKPRKWTNLDAIPSSVKAITDRDGDRAEPQTLKGKRAWVFTDFPFDGLEVPPDCGPFTEVLENE